MGCLSRGGRGSRLGLLAPHPWKEETGMSLLSNPASLSPSSKRCHSCQGPTFLGVV